MYIAIYYIIEDMKERCIMCAATENFKHPDYVDWVKYILYLCNYFILYKALLYRYAVTNVLHGYTLNVLMKPSA